MSFLDWFKPRASAKGRAAIAAPPLEVPEDWREAHARAYASANLTRLTAGWYASSTSANAELLASLRLLRDRSRALVRDNAYAKRAKWLIVNNVIGGGIDIQAQVRSPRGELQDLINGQIEERWHQWEEASNCHIANALHYRDLERLCFGEIFEAGEILLRFHYAPTPCGVPLQIEVIEPERLADEFETPNPGAGAIVRMGIEVDRYHKPIAAYLKTVYPGDIQRGIGTPAMLERVSFHYLQHAYVFGRWPQSRGEPWMHAVSKRLWDVDGYTEAEIVGMRAAASHMGIIQRPDAEPDPDAVTPPHRDVAPGTFMTLEKGETFTEWNPKRSNGQQDPFLRFMLREISAGINVGYASLTGDYSQANYSSERARMLEDRDHWRVLQWWFIRAFRARIHKEFIRAAVFAGKLPAIRPESYILEPSRFEAVRYKLRGWGWVDPTKEVSAYKEAIKGGLVSLGDVIAATGNGADFEETIERIALEKEFIESKGLTLDVLLPDPAPEQAAPTPASPAPADSAQEESVPAEGRTLKVVI